MGIGKLPDFPWDLLIPARRKAEAHPDGLVDLSIGTPVDPTPAVVQEALKAHADAAPYPMASGSADLRRAIVGWCERRRNVVGLGPEAVLPTIGSKELVAWLPTMLGIGAGDIVGVPPVAYPTYLVGSEIAGAEVRLLGPPATLDSLGEKGRVKLIWLNTPGNPHGEVHDVAYLRQVVEWARANDVVVASDECYAELDWRDGGHARATPSILDVEVCGESHENLLMVYSLSKQSNLAGYRAGLVAGDPALIARVLQVRKHTGMMMPTPVQHAMVAALSDDEHVQAQRAVYGRRRERLLAAVGRAGLRVEHSDAGLYLWATRDEDCWVTSADLAEKGILVAPGAIYGPSCARHVRIALTATDERVDAACERL